MATHKNGVKNMKTDFQEFNHIQGLIDSAYHEAALKMGLSDSALWILYTLTANGSGCCQNTLCKTTCMTKSTINSALKKMEKEGLLYMQPGKGRNTCIFLTEQGQTLAQNTVCRLIDLENRIFESWSSEDRALLIRLNRDFAERLSASVKEFSPF